MSLASYILPQSALLDGFRQFFAISEPRPLLGEVWLDISALILTREREVPNAVSMGMKANTISLFMVL